METKTKGLKVQEGKTRLIAPDGTVFIHPYFGRGAYAQVMSQIDAAGLKRPAFGDTVNLAYAAWQNPSEKYSKEIIELLESDWLIADTGILYLPDKGVYVQDHPAVNKNGWPAMNEKELADKLKVKDSSVRFTEYDYQIGEQTKEELAKNSFILALAGGKKGADLVAKIAGKYSNKPYLWAFNKSEIKEPTIRVASLGSPYDRDGLLVDGNLLESLRYGSAFGVEKNQ